MRKTHAGGRPRKLGNLSLAMVDHCYEDNAYAQRNANRTPKPVWKLYAWPKPGILRVKIIFSQIEAQVLTENADANKRRTKDNQR